MANVLPRDKKISIVHALCEGNSIRSTERMTGVHRDTIMRLGVRVGQGCERIHDARVRNLGTTRVEVDEIWGFCGKKQKQITALDSRDLGDTWCYTALDADSKLIASYVTGKRDYATTRAFISDLAARLNNRVQISSDGLALYIEAIENTFGSEVDYAQIVKSFEAEPNGAGRYSPPKVTKVETSVVTGNPDMALLSTSYVEAQNRTIRMHVRRMTRLTNAFSKKLENHKAALSLHFFYYNWVRRHGTIRCTPAMAAGLAPSFWTVGDMLDAAIGDAS